MNSSNSTSGPSPSIAPPTRSFLVLLLDGTRLRVSSSDLAAQLRQERSAGLKRLRQARAEALAQAADGVSEARIRSAFEANERAVDAAIRRLSKQVRVKPEPQRRPSPEKQTRSRSRSTGHSGLVLVKRAQAASALARRDRLGREGMMLRVRYVRAGGNHAAPGCLRRHWHYIAREAAVTLDSDGKPIVLSNLGDTIDDVAEGVALQEQVLRATRKNAKLGFRIVGAFPYGFPVDARREVLQRIGDQLFGARGLPWSGAAHDADPAAEVDNPHFHFDYGLLPMARQPDGSYIVSNDLRTDLDGKEGLRFVRHMVAQVMTEVAQDYGLARTFTALSYRERDMDREGGEHVGQEATAAQRRGDYVASVARNDAKRRRDEAREKARKARERLDALERLKRAIAAEVTSAPSMTIPAEHENEFEMVSIAPVKGNLPTLVDTMNAGLDPSLTGYGFPVTLALSADPPHLGDVPANLALRLPSAVRDGPALPIVTMLPDPVEPMPAVPGVSLIPPRAPTIATVQRLVRIGNAPPRMLQIGKLYAVAAPAPSLAAPSGLSAIGDDLPDLAAPPALSRIGAAAPRLREPTSTIFDIGRRIATGAADEALEAQLNHAIEQEAARARNAAAEQSIDPMAPEAPLAARQDTGAPRAALAASEAARAAALEALRQRDDWVSQDADGRFTVSDEALRAVGLSDAELVSPVVQAAIETIGNSQVDRFDPVFADLSGRPPFNIDQGALRLDERFPAKLQADITRWRADPQFQAFVDKIWPLVRAIPAPSPKHVAVTPSAEPRLSPGAPTPALDPWIQAAALRQRAMAEWDEIERSDGVGMTRPGRILTRPGQVFSQDIDATPLQDRKPIRPYPGMFPGGGGSIGG